ncbi:MAG: PH domain-containing protein [Candidatus Magasanikbacteria bacterium]|nr:PH domain-containing protein [Candidatus Magasanikbacteria bacterium]
MQVAHLIKQKPYEKIEYYLRRHPLTFLPILGVFIILLLVPVAMYFLVNNLFPQLLTGQLSYPVLVLFASIFYLSIYLFFYGQFIDFYLDLWIVTNDRIVDIEQHGLFSRTISELDLYNIQDVTVETSGFFATMFKYGNLYVKTSSDNSQIIFRDIPSPNEVRQALIELAEQDRKFHHTN